MFEHIFATMGTSVIVETLLQQWATKLLERIVATVRTETIGDSQH